MEWLFFLLPIAAVSGWVSARSHYKKRADKTRDPFTRDYFKGINYLLNEQPDKAIDLFIRLLEVNSETVETHLALANLFRRRGETDRAIRIHQNLIARPTLTAEQRNQALTELGLDYMSAGVLDRAEQLFLELLANPATPTEALTQLLRIYQQEKKWPQAIEMAQKIQGQTQKPMGQYIAQFYCELAEQELTVSPHNVHPIIKQAYAYDKNCIRASLIEAQLLIRENNLRKAVKVLKQIEQQDPQFLPEALPVMKQCYEDLGNLNAFNNYLQTLLKHHPSRDSIRIMLTSVIHQQFGEQAAQDYLYKQLQYYPSIEGLHTLLSLGQLSHDMLTPLVTEITANLTQYNRRYTCQHCGFSGKTMHWLCPGCKQWGTVRPTEIHLPALEKQLEPIA